jgi:hypothetical protein
MTRELHTATEVQRAADPTVVPEADRRKGFELRDAPPLKVVAGVAGFAGLLFFGIGFAAATIAVFNGGRLADFPKAKPIFAHADEPQLLDHPEAHRRELVAAASRNLDPKAVEAAIRQVESAGWGETASPTPTESSGQ